MADICGFNFNETQFGWDTCNKKPGHKGDHYDDISKHGCRRVSDDKDAQEQ